MLPEPKLPKYECRRTVWAAKIKRLNPLAYGNVAMQLECWSDPVFLTPEFVAEDKPSVGGYYATDDGIIYYFVPAREFEDTFKLI